MKLEFKQINKYFGDFHVLQDINFSVHSGQIFGYLGRNGAGKTTSIRVLMDVFRQNSGQILLDGKEFNTNDYSIGYLPEERGMYGKTKVKDQLIYFAMLRGATKEAAQKSVTYWTKLFEIDQYLDRNLETLSKGNQQKVQITQAFLNEPDILILDEPFSGLDPVNSSLFQQALVDYISDDKIIIFSSHQMSYVESFCDDIAIIDRGKIVLDGKLEDIKKEIGANKKRLQTDFEDIKIYLENQGHFVSEDDKSYIISLNEETSEKDFLLGLIQNDINIQSYSEYTPSLQEIFVSKVGESE